MREDEVWEYTVRIIEKLKERPEYPMQLPKFKKEFDELIKFMRANPDGYVRRVRAFRKKWCLGERYGWLGALDKWLGSMVGY